jgi:hypothetical protein
MTSKSADHLPPISDCGTRSTSVPLGYFGATDPAVLASNVPAPGKRDTNNWGPRVGLPIARHHRWNSRRPFRRRTICYPGGFGIGYDVSVLQPVKQSGSKLPSHKHPDNTGCDTSRCVSDAVPKTNVVTFNPLATFVNLPSDTQNPTTNYWSLSLQRQLNSNFIVEMGYSGNRSYHLLRRVRPIPGN